MTTRRLFLATSFLLALSGTSPGAAGSSDSKPQPEAIRTSPLSEEQKAAHLLNRLTYGPTPEAMENLESAGFAEFIEQQLHPETIDDSTLDQRLQRLESIHLSTRQLWQLFPRRGIVKRLIDEGVIDRDQAPRGFRRSFVKAARNSVTEGQPESRALSSGKGKRGWLAEDSNPIYRKINYLPEPVEPPGRTGRFRLPILGINPQGLVVAQMQAAKILRAVHSERQIEEVMVDFWMNHFNVFMAKGIERVLVPGYERDAIRPHALGAFRDLLGATARSPAMLFYLDNFQSISPDSWLGRQRDRGLNENYARELMELHTLGVDGGYTQRDVLEVAKVFTGWTIGNRRRRAGRRRRGRDSMAMEGTGDQGFRFVRAAHAPGDKKVLGYTIPADGIDEGEKVLDLLASHPSTARFLATKLVRRFVADDPPASLVNKVAETYRKTGGGIRSLLRTIVYSEEFWSEEAFQAKTKKPLELVASTFRVLGTEVTPTAILLAALDRLSEPLYLCRPPTGYPDVGSAWLNSGTLLYRWKFALGTATGRLPGIEAPRREDLAGKSASEVLQQLSEELLPGQLSETTRASIEKTIMEQLRGRSQAAAPLAGREVAYLAGLILGSPEFQRK